MRVGQHSWRDLKASNLPVPMRSDPVYQRQLETAPCLTNEQEQLVIQRQAGFSYRTATGELIYALVAARPEISFATTKVTQYGSSQALVHYHAVKAIFAFLVNTLTDGLIFWRQQPRDNLPDVELPTPRSSKMDILPALSQVATAPIAFLDSDSWGADTTHQRSVSVIIIMVAGAAVVYKTHYQNATALLSTEAEFISASDAGKMNLYVRSILHDLEFLQPRPTPLHIDNRGALHMVTAGAPTKRTRHVETRYFALLQPVG